MQKSFVAAVSEGAVDAMDELRSESAAGALPQPPVIIFNGVAVNNEPRLLDRLPGERVKILFAGRFENQKGVDLLPQIIRQIKLCRPNL